MKDDDECCTGGGAREPRDAKYASAWARPGETRRAAIGVLGATCERPRQETQLRSTLSRLHSGRYQLLQYVSKHYKTGHSHSAQAGRLVAASKVFS